MKTSITALLISTAVFSGCAVGPDYTRPELVTPTAFSQSTSSTTESVNQWWTVYNDPTLTNLIERANTENHNLAALYQRTLQARAIISRSRADGRPQLNADGSYSRFQDSDELNQGNGRNDELYRGGVTLGWELDLFGRVSRLVESAEADARTSEAEYRNFLLITQTDVAINYYHLRAIVREIEALQRSVDTRKESYNIVQERFDSGRVSDLDVAQAETLLSISEADLAEL